jgi:hypothetical protein
MTTDKPPNPSPPNQTRPAPVLDYAPPTVRSKWLKLPLDWSRRAAGRLPQVCCMCLNPEHKAWAISVMSGASLRIPICDQCKHVCRKRQLRAIAWVCALAAAAYGFVVWRTYSPNSLAQSLLVPVGIPGTIILFGLLLSQSVGLPLRIGIMSRWSSTMCVRFRNPRYHAMCEDPRYPS